MARDDENRPMMPSALRIAFGIFMIIIYVGVGVLLLINFFDWVDVGVWRVLRWVGGVLFILYGLWRAWRQFKGVDSPL